MVGRFDWRVGVRVAENLAGGIFACGLLFKQCLAGGLDKGVANLGFLVR